MNQRQKLVQQQFLNNEEKVIKRLNTVYNQSLKDINEKIKNLQFDIGRLQAEYDWMDPNDPEKAKVKSMIQSKIYQKNYQEQLHKQLDGIVNQMQTKQYLTISDYLNDCYTDGFVGTIFDAHGQGVPIITPIDQESMVRAVQLDSKISKGLYTRLGEDVDLLKRKIIAQVSRGISTGMSFAQVAKGLSDYTRIGYNNSVRIARTEGHRIQNTAAMNAMNAAKEKGADVVKQWDATLDGRTRESHQAVDGEIRELDKPFSNGLDFPGDPSGGAAEVVNCRCAILQRATAALDEDELQTLKDRAEYFGLDKSQNFDDFKKNYLKATENSEKVLTNHQKRDIIQPNLETEEMKGLVTWLKADNVEYREVQMHKTPLTDDEIIQALAGGDLTKGSCASVGLAYIGQKGGMNVLDFRDGASRNCFSTTMNLKRISRLPNVKTIRETAKSAVTAGKKLLKHVEVGKEYYFVCGRHAAIVRKNSDGVLQYLELQSATRSGWTNFNGNPGYTLKTRFGDYRLGGLDIEEFMIDIDSLKDSDDLRYLLGYINTADDKQRKGIYGTIK